MANKEKKNHIRESRRQFWEDSWKNDSFSPAWKGRGISPEIVQMFKEGWFSEKGSILDVGCGEGTVSEWFSRIGYDTIGIDIAQSVINKAQHQYVTSENEHLLKFLALDITETLPPDKQYDIIIDRGCLHSIHPSLAKNYVINLAKVSSPTAKMLLYVRAFRNGIKFNDPKELHTHNKYIKEVFDGYFEVKAYMATNIGKTFGEKDAKWLPGIVYKIERSH